MPYKSFEKLLERFPYFLDKNSNSNFAKSETVFNEEFKEIYNNLHDVYLSSKLEKHILIWKEQSQPYIYDMYFAVSLPYLKEIEIIKRIGDDDTVIYTESFEFDDNINRFEYLHSSTSDNIIPDEQYILKATTWEEYTLTKGFPENNVDCNDEFDHDQSLDLFGDFINVPRKKYVLVDSDEYAKTEPPYNNQLSEDDYHYMNRLIYYIKHLQDTPLPVLEIWKLFGLESELLNRERLIARMIDITRHSENGAYNRSWIPQKWEHKDTWCSKEDENLFFFANVNNNSPIQLQDFTFDFNILNSLGQNVNNTDPEYNIISGETNIFNETENPFIIIPYLNGKITEEILFSDEKWTINTEYINHERAVFVFKCFKNMNQVEQNRLENGDELIISESDLVSEEIILNVRGCNTADWYVDKELGDDNNHGTSKETAFKTLDKALSVIEGEKNIISLSDGKHILKDISKITEDTNIISCPDSTPVVYCDNSLFFKVMQDAVLYIQNVSFRHKCCINYIKDSSFTNNNNENNSLNVRLIPYNCLTETSIDVDAINTVYYDTEFTLTGKLSTDNSGVGSEVIKLFIDDELNSTVTTDSAAKFAFDLIFDTVDTHDITIIHEDSAKYCESEYSTQITVHKLDTVINIDSSNVFTVDSEVIITGSLLRIDDKILDCDAKLKINDDTEVNVNSDGSFNINLGEFAVENYELTLTYDGNEYYNSCEKTFNFLVVDTKFEIIDSNDAHTDITISSKVLDNLGTDDYLILDTLSDEYDKVIIVDKLEDVDVSKYSENDIILINNNGEDIDILIRKKEDS